MTALSVMIN